MRWSTYLVFVSCASLSTTVHAEELVAGSRCELARTLRVSAKAKGKGKKKRLKKGSVLELVDVGKTWSEVKSDETIGFARTRQLKKNCTMLEPEGPSDDDSDTATDEAVVSTDADTDSPSAAEDSVLPAEDDIGSSEAAKGDAASAEIELAPSGEMLPSSAADESAPASDDGAATGGSSDDEAATAGGSSDAQSEPSEASAAEPFASPPPSDEGLSEETSDGPSDMLEIGAGLLAPYGIGDVQGYGVGGMLELRYNITRNFAAGLRAEGDVLFSSDIKGNVATSVGLNVASAYALKAEAQLFDEGISPMGGVGIGMYKFVGASGDADSAGLEAGTLFGLAPQLGVDLGGFRMAVLYHLLFGKTEVSVGNAKVSRNFLAFELSGQIGLL